MAESWAKRTLRPASFRGVPFWVEEAGKSLGRAVATHEYPLKDWPFHEDLGRATRQIQVYAILIGDDVVAQVAALEAALEQPGAGQLVHPWYGALSVVAVGQQHIQWSLREGRVGRATLTFNEDAGQRQPTAAVDTSAATSAAADRSLTAVAADAARALRLDGVVDFVRNDVLGVVNGARDALSEALRQAGALAALPDQLLSQALADVAALVPNQLAGVGVGSVVSGLVSGRTALADLVAGRIGATTVLFSSLVPGRSGAASADIARPVPATTAGAGFDLDVAALIDQVAGGERLAVAADQALPALLALAGDGTPEDPGYEAGNGLSALPAVSATLSRATQAANRETLTTLVRAVSAVEAARVATRREYASRDDVEAARDSVTAALDAASDRAGAAGWDATWRLLAAVKAAAVTDLSVTAQPLPTLAVYQPAAVLPAILVAHRLYGDDPSALFDRAADLTARNRVSHPGFVPARPLEVLRWQA